MNLAASNIAWPSGLDIPVYELLAATGIRGVEVAPTRIWPEWKGITANSTREFRRTVEDSGLCISSLQSILFQKPELQIFGSPEDREALYRHLCDCADLAVELGATCLVFGAPKIRDRRPRSEEDAFAIAAEFFSRAGTYYTQRGVCLVFEANPAQYGCTFATDSVTAARLVRTVNSPGFRLHLDTACMHLAGEDAIFVIGNNDPHHFHVSEPYLGAFSSSEIPHRAIASALKSYRGWVSLEMRIADPPLPALKQALGFLKETYGG
jgi:sugar phosphate isomerase/epimerase